jgi:cell division protein FtsB
MKLSASLLRCLLSILFGLFLIKLLIKNADMISKIVLGIANILLLYTSANGIQSGYSFMSRPDDVSQSASLIPFIEARPWLPDNYQASIIDSLEEENTALAEMVAELKESRPYYEELQSLREKHQSIIEDLSSLNEIAADLKNENQTLQDENNRLKETITQLIENC